MSTNIAWKPVQAQKSEADGHLVTLTLELRRAVTDASPFRTVTVDVDPQLDAATLLAVVRARLVTEARALVLSDAADAFMITAMAYPGRTETY